MPRVCTVCTHPEREAIDQAVVLGEPIRGIARRFDGAERDALRRHQAHISPALARIAEQRAEAGAVTAAQRLEELYGRASKVLDAAEGEGKASLSLAAIRELRGLVELLAKISGELDERPVTVINLAESAEWVQLRGMIMAALAPHPDAAQAVVAAIEAGS